MSEKIQMLNEKAKEIRKLTIQTIGELGVGHIGGAYRCVKRCLCCILMRCMWIRQIPKCRTETGLFFQKDMADLQYMPHWH